MASKRLRVIDFFSGAGGFSEGFRQQGFDIVMGIDNWQPAVDTHNLNHGLNDKTMSVLDYAGPGTEAIDGLPNTEVIIGSPPCVSFSMSNKAGKADKALGIRLIEAYLRVVAVKKHQPGSILVAWYMENVPNSRNYVNEDYTFADLDLTEWAEKQGFNPFGHALSLKNNGAVLVAADYGAPQKRERFVCGELVKDGRFLNPARTHSVGGKDGLKTYVTLKDIKGNMPSPRPKEVEGTWVDPNYPKLELSQSDITDHFYDTGVYAVEWDKARFFKLNHPFMGKMSFPEAADRPSRTIMATRSASTREAIIYKSEFSRKGDGEYRLPTIREASSLMGFPYTYQFVGSEGTKWKLIGNSVCSHMSSAMAAEILKAIGREPIKTSDFPMPVLPEKFNNLNDGLEKKFIKPPKRSPIGKFRRHPFKDGGMTVSLTNFNPHKESVGTGKWHNVVWVGSGKSHHAEVISVGQYETFASIIQERFGQDGQKFLNEYEAQFGSIKERLVVSPEKVISDLGDFIDKHTSPDVVAEINPDIIGKHAVPQRQLYAMYAINRVVS